MRLFLNLLIICNPSRRCLLVCGQCAICDRLMQLSINLLTDGIWTKLFLSGCRSSRYFSNSADMLSYNVNEWVRDCVLCTYVYVYVKKTVKPETQNSIS